ILKGVQIAAGLAVADYNLKNPDDPIRVDAIQQGKITIKVLTHPKLFPPGFRPAFAIKDGFLLIASSPEAITRFAPRDPSPAAKGEATLLRLSPAELGQVLNLRRPQVVQDLRQKQNLSAQEAERTL